MAVFRTVENRRAMVRSTASGQTCVIMPDGRVRAESAPFQENYLVAQVPLVNTATVYTALGDFFPILSLAVSAVILLFMIICSIMKSNGNAKANFHSHGRGKT
jgi:apolipoprotein N-acyltransferase